MFIAVVGIAAGPSFVTGFQGSRIQPVYRRCTGNRHPSSQRTADGKISVQVPPCPHTGMYSRARTTTAALGAIQDALGSDTPALGYTVTYAVGNTLLIIWGVAIVLLM